MEDHFFHPEEQKDLESHVFRCAQRYDKLRTDARVNRYLIAGLFAVLAVGMDWKQATVAKIVLAALK